MGLQLSSLLIGDSRGTADTFGVSGVTDVPTGDSRTAGEGPTEAQKCNEKGKEENDSLPDQCGLYDDGIAWVRKTPAQRKRTTEEPAEKQAKYRLILKQIFSVQSIIGQRVDFDPNDVIQIAVDAYKYLASEPSLIEDVAPPLTIIGDLHGQLYDLNRVFMMHEKEGKPGYESGAKFVCLGNYVDRGRQSLEVIMGLFILKILYPDNVFLLRGNHEFIEMNGFHGFADQLKERFNWEAAKMVFTAINTTFCWLSLAAIIGGKYFLVHAGISTTGFNLRNLRNLRKPLKNTDNNYLVHDMMWSDPAVGLSGTCHNVDRETSIYFGRDAFAHAMHKIGCIIMIRGHSRLNEGATCTWNRIYSIFSASACGYQSNKGSYATLSQNLGLDIYIMPVDENRLSIEKALGFDKKKELEEEPDSDTEVRNDSLGDGTIAAFKK